MYLRRLNILGRRNLSNSIIKTRFFRENKFKIYGRDFSTVAKERNFNWIQLWLGGLCGLVGGIVWVGGLTRLTESGLSMVTWKPHGQIPPLSEEEWEKEFDLYKQFPEYRHSDQSMTLSEFKRIYYYEWTHRMMGRWIGIYYFLGMGLLWKKMPSRTRLQALGIGTGIGCQGLLGWYMVKSGLDDSEGSLIQKYKSQPRVSQYRLTSHLMLAFSIYGLSLYSLLDLRYMKHATFPRPMNIPPEIPLHGNQVLRRWTPMIFCLIALTAAAGGFVAGMDAGLVYNEFPLMGGRIIPEDAWRLKPTWYNFFENASMVQWQHRFLATLTTFAIGAYYHLGVRYGNQIPKPMKRAMRMMGLVVILQYMLGIGTLLSQVHVHMASTHQMGSLALFSTGVWALNMVKRLPK